MRRAVIDVGSNSVLLTVCERTEGGWQPVIETSTVTALGSGVAETKSLSEEAIARTVAAVEAALLKTEESETRLFGTMALRVADNADRFLERAEGLSVKAGILSGADEAELGIRSVTEDPTFSSHPVITMIDVGGQSTEIAVRVHEDDGWEQGYRESFAVGTLRMRDGSLNDEQLDRVALLHGAGQLDEELCQRPLEGTSGSVVAVGATGCNLVSIRESMTEWDAEKVHGAWLEFEEISRFASMSSGLTDSERAALVGIEPGRERTIHLGALILERSLHHVHADGCYVSVRGWRHAVITDDSYWD